MTMSDAHDRRWFIKASTLGAVSAGVAGAGLLGGAPRPAAAASDSSEQLGNTLKIINVRDFGAKGDDETDDTQAFQAAVDYVGGVSYGNNGGRIYVPEGTYVISDTILFRRKAIIFEGAGWGNPVSYGPNPGRGTAIRWADGAGNKPMFEVQDSRGMAFRDFRMQGNNNDEDRPLAGIRFHHSGSIGHGNNTHLLMENVFIGRWVWTDQGLRQGDVDHGVLVDGENGNNDQMYFNAVRISSAKNTGIHLANTQSVWSLFQNCAIGHCGTGFHANCDTTLLNCQFNRNDLDLHVPGTGWVSVFGYQSENAGMLLKMGGYAKVFIDGGYSQIGDIDNDEHLMIDGYGSRSGQMLSLRNHSFRQGGDPRPKIRLKPDEGRRQSNPNMFVMENCHGLRPEMLDMNIVDRHDERHIYWRQSNGTFFRQFLDRDNPAVDPARWEMDTQLVLREALRHEGAAAGFFGAEPVEKPVVTGSWADGSAARSLAAALAKLGLIDDQTTDEG